MWWGGVGVVRGSECGGGSWYGECLCEVDGVGVVGVLVCGGRDRVWG